MTEFKNALITFRETGQSIDVLLSEIERFIKNDKINPTLLLEELTQENIENPFSPEELNSIKDQIVAVAKLLEDKEIDFIEFEDTVELDQYDSTVKLDNTDDARDFNDSQTEAINEDLVASSSENISQSPKPKNSTDVDVKLQSQSRADRTELEGLVLNDRYTLEKRLGSGGMGMVYRAIDHDRLKLRIDNPYVAIKILRHGVPPSQDWFQNLQEKVKSSQQLAHPNIVDIYEINRDQDIVYLVMQYLPGKTLREKMRASDFQRLSLKEALPFIQGMGEALSFAHDHGIVHYDFKPNNVIITDKGQIKVIDFGMAREYKSEMQEDRSRTDSVILTPVYASPEMLERQPPDPRDDIYALGITVYELLTGSHPFARKRATQARDAGLEPQQPAGLMRNQWQALKQALSFKRCDRTSNVREFLEGLNVYRRSKIINISLRKGMAAASVIAFIATISYLILEDNGIQDQFDSLPNSTGLGVKDSAHHRPQAAIVDKPSNTQTDVQESEGSTDPNQSMFASLEEQQAIEQSSHTAREPVTSAAESANLPSEKVKTDVPQDSDSTATEPDKVLLPSQKTKSETAAVVNVKSEPPSRAVEQGWVVQVGSFRLRNNAAALRDKLKAAGYEVIEEKGETRNIPIYRVKVGPVEKRKRATVLLAKLRREQKLDGYVANFP